MKRIIISTLALAMMTGLAGSALADRGHRRDDNRHDRVGNRHRDGRDWNGRRDGRRDYRNGRYVSNRGYWQRDRYRRVVRPQRYVSGGSYYVYPTVAPPAIRYERYQPRRGYVWVAGHWD